MSALPLRPARGKARPSAIATLAALALLAALAAAAAWVAWRNVAGEPAVQPRGRAPLPPADAATLARGAYLARAGNCLGCHTQRGSAPGAGGRAVATPFGIVYSSNLTPDDETGIGRWSASEFRRALQHGRSRDGRLLTPAFPYPNFTLLANEDADALYAWLMSRPAVRQPDRPHELRFPYGTQAALAVWRALYFRAGRHEADPARSAAWNRGSYLVNGPAHCFACHAARNFLGAAAGAGGADGSREAGGPGAGGGIVSTQRWYAPSLTDPREAGVADWPIDDVVALLKTGTSPRGSAMGPMAEVVARSTQHLADEDLWAMAEYLRSLPAAARSSTPAGASAGASAATRAASTASAAGAPAASTAMTRGGKLFEQHCAACHGERGEGTPGIAALAGHRAVRLSNPQNVIQAVRHGGFLPTTAGNPRPFGMPPFGHLLGDDDIAAVATYVRGAWGNAAPAVEALDVWRAR